MTGDPTLDLVDEIIAELEHLLTRLRDRRDEQKARANDDG